MSTILIDGFDHYTTNEILAKWDNGAFNGPCISGSAGRRGGGCLELDAGEYVYKLFPNATTVMFGAALRFTALPTNASEAIAQWINGGEVQATLWLSPDGSLKVYRGAALGTLLLTTDAVLTVGTYLYVEAKILFSHTAGTAGIHVTTPTTALSFSATALDTSVSASGETCNCFKWLGTSGTLRVDDFYLLDGSGSSLNDFLGDCRVDTSLPRATGSSAQFTVAAGSTGPNFDVVNDIPPDADYVRGSFVGAVDKYAMQPVVSVTGAIHTVQVTTYAKASVAGLSRINHVVCNTLGSDDVLSAPLEVGLGFKFLRTITPQRPATVGSPAAPWTAVGINGAQFGVKVAE